MRHDVNNKKQPDFFQNTSIVLQRAVRATRILFWLLDYGRYSPLCFPSLNFVANVDLSISVRAAGRDRTAVREASARTKQSRRASIRVSFDPFSALAPKRSARFA